MPQLCRDRGYPFVRLDGSTTIKKRNKLVGAAQLKPKLVVRWKYVCCRSGGAECVGQPPMFCAHLAVAPSSKISAQHWLARVHLPPASFTRVMCLATILNSLPAGQGLQ